MACRLMRVLARLACAAVAATLCVFFAAGRVGVCESAPLLITATATPSEMAAPGEAEIRLYVSNSGATDVRIARMNGEVLEEAGDAASHIFTEKTNVTQENLDAGGVSYAVQYTADGKRKSVVVTASIRRVEAVPTLELTRSASCPVVQKDGEVTLTYRVRNAGNVPLTNISIKDSLCGTVGALDALDPGKKSTFTCKATITEACQSAPVATYSCAADGRDYEKRLEPLKITLADERMGILLSADKSAASPGDVVTLRLTLVNNGNVTYDSMRVSDAELGELGSIPSELRPGQEYIFSKTLAMKSTATFQFAVTGECAGGGALNAVSNALTVSVSPATEDVSIGLSAATETPELSEPGTLTVYLTVNNRGETDISDVTLSERSRGVVKTLAVAAPGETRVDIQYQISGEETLLFMAELRDARGGRLTVLSNPLTVAVRPGASAPGEAQQAIQAPPAGLPDENAVSYTSVSNRVYPLMMAGVALVIAALLGVFAVGALRNRRRKKKLRDMHLQRLRRTRRNERAHEEKMETTRRHVPVRRAPPQDGRAEDKTEDKE